jgi:hypothetical protein
MRGNGYIQNELRSTEIARATLLRARKAAGAPARSVVILILRYRDYKVVKVGRCIPDSNARGTQKRSGREVSLVTTAQPQKCATPVVLFGAQGSRCRFFSAGPIIGDP